jgi:hypothetical protein
MSNQNPFQQQSDDNQDDTDNQPALRMPRVDRQRDMGSGLNAGTAPGIESADPYQQGQVILPGADPYAGAGDGRGLDGGQYRGSDDGTTTDQGAGTLYEDGNERTDLALDQGTYKNYQPGTSKDEQDSGK